MPLETMRYVLSPVMGKRDFDDDAERIGRNIVKTAQMPGGFRGMAKAHLPTAKETVIKREAEVTKEIAANRFTAAGIKEKSDRRHAWIEKRGGKARVERCLSFAVWFCQEPVDSTGERQKAVTGALALGDDTCSFVQRPATFSPIGAAITVSHSPLNATASGRTRLVRTR
jgi:hypothetical protein